MVAEIDRHALVEIFGRRLVDRVAVVARGVVDQDRNRTDSRTRRRDRRLERRDVAQVAALVERLGVSGRADRGHGVGRRRIVDVDEGDARTLRREMLDDRGTDARGAAGDEHRALAQAGVGGELHGSALPPPAPKGGEG